jgi:hypothetical protein
MYGADALIRKYGDRPPEEWSRVVNAMRRPEFERGLRRLLHSGKAMIPTLPEFLRLAREVGGENDPAQPLLLTPPLQPPPDQLVVDSNRRLLDVIFRSAYRWGPRRGDRAGRHEEDVAVLNRWRREWVRMMRDASPEDREENAVSWWRNVMRQAWAEIDPPAPVARRAPEPQVTLQGWDD